MASSISAPITPAIMENMTPPLPAPAPMPRRLRRKPPMTAPTIPRMMVTIIPPGSSPGMISLPNAPAMSPTMIQNIRPVIILFAAPFPVVVGLVRPHLCSKGDYRASSTQRHQKGTEEEPLDYRVRVTSVGDLRGLSNSLEVAPEVPAEVAEVVTPVIAPAVIAGVLL